MLSWTAWTSNGCFCSSSSEFAKTWIPGAHLSFLGCLSSALGPNERPIFSPSKTLHNLGRLLFKCCYLYEALSDFFAPDHEVFFAFYKEPQVSTKWTHRLAVVTISMKTHYSFANFSASKDLVAILHGSCTCWLKWCVFYELIPPPNLYFST